MDDLSRLRIKELLEREFIKTNTSLDRIEEGIARVEISSDFVHTLRRQGKKHLRLVKDDLPDDHVKE